MNTPYDITTLAVVAFCVVVAFIACGTLLLGSFRDPVASRLETLQPTHVEPGIEDELFEEDQKGVLGALFPFMSQSTRRKMGDRLVHAGLYRPNSIFVYVATKLLLIGVPATIGLMSWTSGAVTGQQALLFTVIIGIAGTIAPGFYLDYQLKQRQTNLKRAIPDALDVVIVCVEGGLSVPASFAKVTTELNNAHPLLAMEMAIVQREIQMGRSTGEALKNLANRFDLEELRGLAGVVLQAERFGASVVKALQVHADSLREKRLANAEELAAKAAVKVLFPTLVCIFPSMFIVILGPAVFDILEMFERMGLN